MAEAGNPGDAVAAPIVPPSPAEEGRRHRPCRPGRGGYAVVRRRPARVGDRSTRPAPSPVAPPPAQGRVCGERPRGSGTIRSPSRGRAQERGLKQVAQPLAPVTISTRTCARRARTRRPPAARSEPVWRAGRIPSDAKKAAAARVAPRASRPRPIGPDAGRTRSPTSPPPRAAGRSPVRSPPRAGGDARAGRQEIRRQGGGAAAPSSQQRRRIPRQAHGRWGVIKKRH